jgi:hypothetical protein
MGTATHLCAAPMSQMGVSVGGLRRRPDQLDRGPLGETLCVFQRHAAGRLPVVSVIRTSRAVRPAVFMHGHAVVRLGGPVLPTAADEVDAIVHTRIDARDTGSTSPLQGR